MLHYFEEDIPLMIMQYVGNKKRKKKKKAKKKSRGNNFIVFILSNTSQYIKTDVLL